MGIGLLAAGLILIGGLLLVLDRSTTVPTGPARVGAALPDFTLTELSGKQVKLSDYAGHPVLINAWATWCPPCRAEMLALHDFYREHWADGFVLLAVNAGETQAQVRSFIQQTGFTFPVLLDPNTALLTDLGIRSFPTSILVGRDGKVKTIHVGMLTADQLQTEIAPLLVR
ncbi:MAG: TlpA family protein disulfide reductase [Anaerolineae bacterium]